jgi:hypothetical protein
VVDHDRHWRRLLRSLAGIDLAVPAGMDEEALRAISERVLAECGLGAGTRRSTSS